MILYFSGTGNSEYVAKRIQDIIGDDIINLFEKIQKDDFNALSSNKPWVIVTPTYAWRIPRIVDNWLKRTELAGNKDVYFVMTCGTNIGNASRYLKQLCLNKQMNYKGCQAIVMPENYIALFKAPNRQKAIEIIDQSNGIIDDTANMIKQDKDLLQPKITLIDKLSSGLVNDGFYPLFVHAKKFKVTDKCISCKKCELVCPLNNISFKDGKPVWGDNCTHCMACINKCPVAAIEYGKRTKNKIRYVLPKWENK